MIYKAHWTPAGKYQTVREHLESVSRLCADYAVPELKEYARLCGLLHDLGKYTKAFQRRVNGDNVKPVEHARYGAQELSGKKPTGYLPMVEYCIAGHHSGLHDGGTRADNEDAATLHGLMKRHREDYSAFKNEIDYTMPEDRLPEIMKGCKTKEEIIELYAFLTRYLFSCLTDADFIDTERFFSPDTDRGLDGDFEKALELLNKKLASFRPKTELQKARGALQNQVYESLREKADVYFMDMPTGSGKTLCSLKAALEKAISEKKKRIIYIIPYVSIIEQTAEVFEDILGDALPVLQHHSNYDFDLDDGEDETTSDKLKRACENWDAGLIVTTNIQFFESLYHYKGSRLRKLHNLADSVVVFDEFHTLPIGYIQPCLRAVGYITKYLGATALIMSATMPDYSELMREYLPGCKAVSAVRDKSLFPAFEKCRYSFAGEISLDEAAAMAEGKGSVLIVVNSRKTAKELFNICRRNREKVYHLSTHMTPAHRTRVIVDIRKSLEAGEDTVVVSTSLIEAGVDLDFNTVMRENSGLDSVIQAGGRCNREGKRSLGEVIVFETGRAYGDIAKKANMTRSLFREFDNVASEECVKEYYRRLFAAGADAIKHNSISAMAEVLRVDAIPFRSYAGQFGLIDNETVGILIPDGENAGLVKNIERLENGVLSVKRKLQKYCASVRHYEFKKMVEMGIVEQLPGGVWVLTNTAYYDKDFVGLDLDREVDYIL